MNGRHVSLVAIAGLLLSGITLLPTAVADDCTSLASTGAGGVYSCPGGRIEVRSSGTLLAAGPTSGAGWYVTSGPAYVAADFTCWDGWCYVTAAAFPAAGCSIRFNTATHQVVTCPL
jgi:hypothetical protein